MSAAQVEQELAQVPGVQFAQVSSVPVPGYDGRVGLALIVPAAGFEVAHLEALRERLPRTSLPRFVRLVAELPRTSSLKLKRQAWADDGVDPERVLDPLWLLVEGKYRRLDAVTYRDVLSGSLRL